MSCWTVVYTKINDGYWVVTDCQEISLTVLINRVQASTAEASRVKLKL